MPFAQLLRVPLRVPDGLYPRTTLQPLLLLILLTEVLPGSQSHPLLVGAILLVGSLSGTLTHFEGVPFGRAQSFLPEALPLPIIGPIAQIIPRPFEQPLAQKAFALVGIRVTPPLPWQIPNVALTGLEERHSYEMVIPRAPLSMVIIFSLSPLCRSPSKLQPARVESNIFRS